MIRIIQTTTHEQISAAIKGRKSRGESIPNWLIAPQKTLRFLDLCEEHEIKPTVRQFNKYIRGRGLLANKTRNQGS